MAVVWNTRQRRFVDEYLIDLNATRAAIRAGYSKQTASAMGSELLKRPEIAEELQRRMNERAKRTEITADHVLKEIARLAFSDMKDFAKWNSAQVELVDSEKLPSDLSSCVAEVSQTSTQYGSNVKLKLVDKLRALEMLGKHLKLFQDRIDIGDVTIRVRLENEDGSIEPDPLDDADLYLGEDADESKPAD